MSLISKRQAFGLDLSDLSLKITQFEKKGKGLNLVCLKRADLPAGLVIDGEIKQPTELAEFLKKTMADGQGDKVRGNKVVCNLPEEKIYSSIIKLPKMKKQEIEQAVYWEAENQIPLKIEEAYLDWQLLNESAGKGVNPEVLLAAAPKTLVDSYLEFLRSAGLSPIALEPESMALVRALIKDQQTQKPVVIIDIGLTGTSFIISSGNGICFNSRIPISSALFDQAIIKNLKVSQEEAVKIKLRVGLAKDENIYKALEPSVRELADKISSSIIYYVDSVAEEHQLETTISQIQLCGGGSLLVGLPEYLSAKLKIPVKIGNPWTNISPFLPKKAQKLGLTYKDSIIYATAFGLALREFI